MTREKGTGGGEDGPERGTLIQLFPKGQDDKGVENPVTTRERLASATSGLKDQISRLDRYTTAARLDQKNIDQALLVLESASTELERIFRSRTTSPELKKMEIANRETFKKIKEYTGHNFTSIEEAQAALQEINELYGWQIDQLQKINEERFERADTIIQTPLKELAENLRYAQFFVDGEKYQFVYEVVFSNTQATNKVGHKHTIEMEKIGHYDNKETITANSNITPIYLKTKPKQ